MPTLNSRSAIRSFAKTGSRDFTLVPGAEFEYFNAMSRITRRTFIRNASAFTIGSFYLPRLGAAESANDRLNVAVIGVANQGNYNLNNVASQNVVALCDVDENYLAKAAEKFP